MDGEPETVNNRERRQVHLICSSHWDREWYLTVEQYRFRLVRCLDRAVELLENDPAWSAYMTDGQTQMVLDYLAVRPEQADAVRRLADAGTLRIGPWRVQPDAQMIGGEAMVRNLLRGHRDCRTLGGLLQHGYLADNFGHISQTPQILRGFGITSASFWRGYDESGIDAIENTWIGADGSRILAVLMPRGYSSAAGYGPGEYDNRKFETHWPRLCELSRTGIIVMGDGTDHALPTPNLADVLAFAREHLDGADEVQQSHWDDVIARIRDAVEKNHLELPVLEGELLFAPGLDSTFSNRIDQKQANMACESLLTRYAEPLASLAAVLRNARYPRGFLDRAWEMMIKNAAHDSIGGSHTDTVARDVMHRFARTAELGAGVQHQAMDALANCRADEYDVGPASAIAVFNPQPTAWSGVVEVEIAIPDHEGRDGLIPLLFRDFVFSDGKHRLLSHVLDDRETARPTYGDRHNPVVRHTRTFTALVEVHDLPPLGVKTIAFDSSGTQQRHAILNADDADTPVTEPDAAPPSLVAGPCLLQNEHLAVTVHPNGTFDVEQRADGTTWTGLNLLVDEQDAGTQYAFSPSRNRRRSLCEAGRVETLLDSPLRGVLRVQTELACFNDRGVSDPVQRRSGNDAAVVVCPIAIDIALDRNSSRVDIAVTLDNRGAGHRLRARFPVLREDSRLLVHSVYDLVNRSPDARARLRNGVTPEQMDERPAAGMCGYQLAVNDNHGFALAGRGLYEYKHDRPAGNLELTLFRSAGAINLGFEAWQTAEGGYLPGMHRMEYACRPFAGDPLAGPVLQSLDAYLHPPLARVYPSGTSCAVRGPELADPRLELTAFKALEDEDHGFVLRFYNRSDEPVDACIPLGRTYRTVERRRLDESAAQPLAENADRITLTAGPKEIVTLALRT